MRRKPDWAKTLSDPLSGASLLTAGEAAHYLNYHPVSVRRLVGQGDLRPYKTVGRAHLFMREELDRFRYGSARAKGKAGVEPLQAPPATPSMSPELKAVVTVMVKGRARVHKRLKAFHWEDIPALRAQVDSRYGRTTFCITIELPDGSGCELRFHPSAMEAEHYGKLR
ncbi:MAG: helix-turn-helix domain-containing protein [Elusimicrobia bacterium]|nr:helix-turn-helix domain-containing protein [Elusimicrobiota bacterium]